MSTTTAPKLTVKLPVCPECGLVGKRPEEGVYKSGYHTFCVGPFGERHPKVRMVPTTFEAVSE